MVMLPRAFDSILFMMLSLTAKIDRSDYAHVIVRLVPTPI